MKVVGENIHQKDEHEEIERIEDPSQYPRGDGEPPSWRDGLCVRRDADRIRGRPGLLHPFHL